ncbi:MAG: hypothetical protein KatS3mg105_5253 [Gemmatales bacterium]|nr:MAG: hypothetical protein KatS3mg105_5253 [Gemmatales bacterium]
MPWSRARWPAEPGHRSAAGGLVGGAQAACSERRPWKRSRPKREPARMTRTTLEAARTFPSEKTRGGGQFDATHPFRCHKGLCDKKLGPAGWRVVGSAGGPGGTVGRLSELCASLSELCERRSESLARQVQASVEFWRSPVGNAPQGPDQTSPGQGRQASTARTRPPPWVAKDPHDP